jgi:maleate isomerase
MTLPTSVPAPAIGIILPSSNRIVERVTKFILEDFPGVDACFARVPYGGHPSDGYDLKSFLHSATMLAQARPSIILWNATRGALIGFEPDRRLCALIEKETGIPATTTALETPALLKAFGLPKIALLQQGDCEEGDRLVATFASQGISILDRRDLGIRDNFEAANVTADEISRLVGELAVAKPDAVLIWSTNLWGHTLTEGLSAQYGIPVFDSAAIGIMSALRRLPEMFEITAGKAVFTRKIAPLRANVQRQP